MKNLARHIELLLRDNDCVILPGFGGFIAHVVPAYYVSEENLYYPPSRSISFNTAITMNDGLLAQSYMRSYNVDYAQAVYLVDVAIEKLRDKLDEEGSVAIPRIGTIKQDIYQTIQFVAEEAGVSSPLHFGLGTFAISTLAQLQSQSSAEVPKKESIITQTDRTIDFHIQKRALWQFLSTAAVFLLLLMAALPVGDLKPTDIASLHLTNIITEPQILLPNNQTEVVVEDTTETVVEDYVLEPVENTEVQDSPEETCENTIVEECLDVHETVIVSNNEAEVATPVVAESPAIVAPTNDNKIYHVIIASLPSRRGADEVVEEYIAKGYQQTSLVERDNRVRVSLAQFTDKDEANNYLKTLRENEAFQNAWLLPVRN